MVLYKKIDDTIIYAEKMYSRNFTVANKTFCLSLHYTGDNIYLFINGKEVTKFKTKNKCSWKTIARKHLT